MRSLKFILHSFPNNHTPMMFSTILNQTTASFADFAMASNPLPLGLQTGAWVIGGSYGTSLIFLAAIVILGAVIAACVGVARVGRRGLLAEVRAGETLEAVDDLCYEETDLVNPPPRGPYLRRFAAVLARDVRMKMGPSPIPSTANRLVAWELLGKACEARDVRKADRLRFMILGCDMVFMPSALDVEAAEIRASVRLSTRMRAVKPEPNWIMWMWGVKPGLTYHKE